jgi:hypothetical protein
MAAMPASNAAGQGTDWGTIVLVCPTAFHREQVIRRYQAQIEAALGSPITLVVCQR